MISFRQEGDILVLKYSSNYPDSSWVYRELIDSDEVLIKKVFLFTRNELITNFNEEDISDGVEFKVANRNEEYYCFDKDIMSLQHNLFIHKSIKFSIKLFIAERGISIFEIIDKLVDGSIYIGGSNDNSIPLEVYDDFLKNFPKSYELKKYVSARIASVLSTYIDMKDDYEVKYQNYLNKKVSKKGEDIKYSFSRFEVEKYKSILSKLKSMLDNEISYNEHQWQEELLQIILLLNPKYIHVFKEAPVKDINCGSNRKIDYLLVDSTGNTDIIEIKKPFDKCIITKNTYRDNFIPLRELSGTVMQIEKYIYYLNKSGRKGEEKLTNSYRKELPNGFQIKITNPSGIIIMGRKKGLSKEQLQDFEIIKRKYKNVIDIITYDDLIERLEFTIKQWAGICEE